MNGSHLGVLRRLIVVAAVTWAVALPLATYAAAQPAGDPWHGLAFFVYGLGAVICHQADDRSFTLWATHLPVCARCTGLYVGAAAAAIGWAQRPMNLSPTLARRLLAAATLPTGASLLYEWTMGTVPANSIRALCGVLLGVGVMTVLRAATHAADQPSQPGVRPVATTPGAGGH